MTVMHYLCDVKARNSHHNYNRGSSLLLSLEECQYLQSHTYYKQLECEHNKIHQQIKVSAVCVKTMLQMTKKNTSISMAMTLLVLSFPALYRSPCITYETLYLLYCIVCIVKLRFDNYIVCK